jgi:hypothetical protein
MSVFFMAIWYIYVVPIGNMQWPFDIRSGHLVGICSGHLVYFMFLVYFSHFGMLYQEQSGNPCCSSRESATKALASVPLAAPDNMPITLLRY